jgi:hypothetical protein
MPKNQKIRREIAAATRRNDLGGARTAELVRIFHRYRCNLLCVGGLRPLGVFYSGGDYWV